MKDPEWFHIILRYVRSSILQLFLAPSQIASVLLKLALSPEQVEHLFSVFSSSASHSADHELSVYLVIRNSELFISIPLIKKYKVLKTIPQCIYIFFDFLSYVCIVFLFSKLWMHVKIINNDRYIDFKTMEKTKWWDICNCAETTLRM